MKTHAKVPRKVDIWKDVACSEKLNKVILGGMGPRLPYYLNSGVIPHSSVPPLSVFSHKEAAAGSRSLTSPIDLFPTLTTKWAVLMVCKPDMGGFGQPLWYLLAAACVGHSPFKVWGVCGSAFRMDERDAGGGRIAPGPEFLHPQILFRNKVLLTNRWLWYVVHDFSFIPVRLSFCP